MVLALDGTDAEARAFWAQDPCVTARVWRDLRLWGTRIAPLPCRPLPGAPA